ncbi:MAG: phosphopentomutase [bacterium]|nr:phosphopentomutase [bacterium]
MPKNDSLKRNRFQRIVVIVLDGLGVGALPDAAEYGDSGSNTLLNLAAAVGGIHLPNLERMGLGHVCPFAGHDSTIQPVGAYGRLAEVSKGKDSTVGHWELMGVVVDRPFPVYPSGFPDEILDPFRQAIGTEILGNVPASGTEIIERLGQEHVRTGYPIVYTSQDSVFQIAAHEEIIPPERLYEWCAIARSILTGPHAVARVIARPFIGSPGNWQRTRRRKDFSLEPPEPTVLDWLKERQVAVVGIGKVADIFAGRGFTQTIPAKGNADTLNVLEKTLSELKEGFILANLVDFDMLYGHRNDPKGYAEALEFFDQRLERLLAFLSPNDLLLITADHGCDPVTPSTDHSREYTPALAYTPFARAGVNLGTRSSFADIAKTIAQNFYVSELTKGVSFLNEII